VTEELHCRENARAERLNGILKQEYSLGVSQRSKKRALQAIDEAVFLYTTRHPHLALNFETPEKMYRNIAGLPDLSFFVTRRIIYLSVFL
jgi:transposase InsO family protein